MCEKDRQLLEQLTVDPERIADVIEEYGAQLLGRLYAYTNDRGYGNADVDDVFQEALLKLFDPKERAAIVGAGGLILPYLTRWGYWHLDTLWRQRVDPLDERALEQQPAANWPYADQVEEADREVDNDGVTPDALTALERVWWQLSPRDQLLLTRRYFESYSETELADHLNSTSGAIKKALYDARRRLRRLMETEGFDMEE